MDDVNESVVMSYSEASESVININMCGRQRDIRCIYIFLGRLNSTCILCLVDVSRFLQRFLAYSWHFKVMMSFISYSLFISTHWLLNRVYILGSGNYISHRLSHCGVE